MLEARVVLGRRTEERRNDRHWQLAGKVADDLASAGLGQWIEPRLTHRADITFELGDPTRRECTADELPELLVPGRIGEDHHRRCRLRALDLFDQGALGGAEPRV